MLQNHYNSSCPSQPGNQGLGQLLTRREMHIQLKYARDAWGRQTSNLWKVLTASCLNSSLIYLLIYLPTDSEKQILVLSYTYVLRSKSHWFSKIYAQLKLHSLPSWQDFWHPHLQNQSLISRQFKAQNTLSVGKSGIQIVNGCIVDASNKYFMFLLEQNCQAFFTLSTSALHSVIN